MDQKPGPGRDFFIGCALALVAMLPVWYFLISYVLYLWR
jgi:hypothetical protein